MKTSDFLSKLTELGGSAGNVTLRNALGWNEPEYNAVKEELVRSRKVVPGRGKGGSVKLAGEASTAPETKADTETALKSAPAVDPSKPSEDTHPLPPGCELDPHNYAERFSSYKRRAFVHSNVKGQLIVSPLRKLSGNTLVAEYFDGKLITN